jgi:hypothetical protein
MKSLPRVAEVYSDCVFKLIILTGILWYYDDDRTTLSYRVELLPQVADIYPDYMFKLTMLTGVLWYYDESLSISEYRWLNQLFTNFKIFLTRTFSCDKEIPSDSIHSC